MLRAAFPDQEWVSSQFRRHGYSAVAIRWLDQRAESDGVTIQHACNGGEVIITGTPYKVDGYCESTLTVYEFLGSYWHADPSVYDSESYCASLNKIFGDLLSETMQRLHTLACRGVRVVYVWESDYKRGLNVSGVIEPHV